MLNLELMNQFYPKNLFSLFSGSLFSTAGGFPKGIPFDMTRMLEAQRRNVQAIAEAQGVVLSGMQTVARQQSEILSGVIESQSALISLFIQEGTPEEKIARHAELTKAQYKDTVHDVRVLQDAITSTLREAADVLHHRTVSRLSERQSSAIKNALVPANSDEITQRKISA